MPDEFGFSTEAEKRASAKYDKEYAKGLYIKLNIRTDQDIIRWLWGQSNKQGAIKALIREDIKRQEERKKAQAQENKEQFPLYFNKLFYLLQISRKEGSTMLDLDTIGYFLFMEKQEQQEQEQEKQEQEEVNNED